MQRDKAFLWDMLTAAARIQEIVQQTTWTAFDQDWKIHDLVERQFITIGEATKRLSLALRAAHPEIPWHRMAGLRDVLTHGYDRIDLSRIWETATVELPAIVPLLEAVERSLPDE